ncbi:hypothetical protein P872_11315 [Rhodonellum psychrophilum GCM71 = DSM 17998]|uniref:Uncharacterized protein n=1 Tax=Rhodonellum psychrophilum GCM71 = DSM 17998 TaxID=1123057 RepID=U5BK36_9BACT|nr:hypothetical protein P872_11315 [Rhodonellum psychrophilum GCM71 = DSM 17998]
MVWLLVDWNAHKVRRMPKGTESKRLILWERDGLPSNNPFSEWSPLK